MLVLHVHIQGRGGYIEKTYDFLRYDGKETLEGIDVVVPFDKELEYPLNESEVLSLLHTKDLKGDH